MNFLIFVTTTPILLFVSLTTTIESAEVFTPSELAEIAQLRTSVKDVLYADYMEKDEYLIKWLTDKRYNVAAASQKLRKSLEWRRANNIDSILEERSVQDIRPDVPYYLEGHDKFGRPIIIFRYGTEWNIRKVALEGKMAVLRRHMLSIMEVGYTMARATGNSTTQWILLADFKGYNFKQHACFACLSLYPETFIDYEGNYPETIKNIVVINAPFIFDTIMRVILPLMSERTRRSFKLYGLNTQAYREFLLKTISPNELSSDFGGIRKVN